MFQKALISFYVVIALSTAWLTLIDFADCYQEAHPNRNASTGIETGFHSVFAGLIWPVSLPGMIITKDNHEGKYCP